MSSLISSSSHGRNVFLTRLVTNGQCLSQTSMKKHFHFWYTGKFRCIIIFTRSCKMLPFEHDLFQRLKRSDKGQHRIRPRFWCGEYLCKITKWYRQFLHSYRVHKAAWPLARLKVQKGHTKVNVKLVRDFYVESIQVKLHDTGNLWRVIVFTRFRTCLRISCGECLWHDACNYWILFWQRSMFNLSEILMKRAFQ